MFSPPVSNTAWCGRPSAVLCVVYSGTTSNSDCSIRVLCVYIVSVCSIKVIEWNFMCTACFSLGKTLQLMKTHFQSSWQFYAHISIHFILILHSLEGFPCINIVCSLQPTIYLSVKMTFFIPELCLQWLKAMTNSYF